MFLHKFQKSIVSTDFSTAISIGIPLLIFLALHAYRPFILGLYHDDWYLFTLPIFLDENKIFENLYAGFKDRPIFLYTVYSVVKTWDGQPETLTLISSGFVGISGFLLYKFLGRITALAGFNSLAASAGTAFWIVIPWGMGYSLWPIGTMTLLGPIFFLGAAILSIDYITRGGNWRVLAVFTTLGLSFFSYQSSYFSYIPLITLAVILGPGTKEFFNRAIILFVASSVIQATSILYAKVVTIKTLSISFKLLFGNVIYSLPVAMNKPFEQYSFVFWLSFIGVIICIALFMKGINRVSQKRMVFAICACCAGIAIGTVPFSLAGYMVQGVGVFSRTTVFSNIWLAVLITISIMMPFSQGLAKAKWLVASVATLILVCSLASGYQINNWAQSWARQNEILETFPVNSLYQVADNSIVILNEPSTIRGVEVFAASWDITRALYSRIGLEDLSHFESRPRIIPFTKKMSWDGKETFKTNENISSTANEVWLYSPSSGIFEKITTPGLIELHINRLN
jgi:hypothetical protein